MIDNTPLHTKFMRAALEQAWLGRGNCAPNPSVGAIAVYNEQIVARAWHQGAGTPHAEQLILQQLPNGLSDVTLYVTLEPCNHWGRTPPCVLSIIEYGISQVVYGFCDPNPVVAANNTAHILQSANIAILHFPLAEIEVFYQSYQYWTLTHKPWVTVKLAQSLDGKIAAAGGKPILLSNSACQEFTHRQRLHTDIILTTAKTIIRDDPLLNVRLSTVAAGAKPLAILDSHGSMPKTARVISHAKYCLIYHAHTKAKQKLPNCRYYAVNHNANGLNLAEIITHLGSLGYHDVWVEAGGILFSALHQANLVQRTYLYLVPRILGEKAIGAFHGENLFMRQKTVSWYSKYDNIIACLDWQDE